MKAYIIKLSNTLDIDFDNVSRKTRQDSIPHMTMKMSAHRGHYMPIIPDGMCKADEMC